MINFFKKKDKTQKNSILSPFSTIMSSVIYTNDQIGIVHDACNVCWDRPPKETLEDQLKYIEKRIAIGHESILEHSNIILLVVVKNDYYNYDILEFLSHCKYLNVKTTKDENDTYLLIGGSIRGYKHIFRNINNINNHILLEIKDCLYNISYPELYIDLINDDIMDRNKFANNGKLDKYGVPLSASNKVQTVNIDPISTILNTIKDVTNDDTLFGYGDLLDLCTATIIFKNMSRTATHQLVRHRNAITQESQRYVDYSDANFSSPDEFKDIYKDKIYRIRLFDTEKELSMKDLGKELMTVYSQLREQEVLKEDARAFLPSNVQCGKLYMTFTFKNLIKFLELRTDKAAQAEIRLYAEIIQFEFTKALSMDIDGLYKYLLPKYLVEELNNDYSNIDEILD